MKKIGFVVIIIGLMMSLLIVIIGTMVNYLEHIRYISWMMAFCQILIFAGIGFILYDVVEAMRK